MDKQRRQEENPIPVPFEPERKRFWELDFLRGFCVILMVIDHFFYSSAVILPEVWEWCGQEFWTGLNEFSMNYWDNFAHSIAHYAVVTLFMLLCGISCTLTNSNLLRGLRAAGVALAITLVTWLGDSFFGMDGTLTIRFGVIHMYACAILIYWVLSLPARIFERIHQKEAKTGQKNRLKAVLKQCLTYLPAAVGITFLIIFFAAPWGRFSINRTDGYNYNKFLELLPTFSAGGTERRKNIISMLIELKNWRLKSADYFPIIPYALIVLAGSLIGHLMYNSRHKYALSVLDGKWNKPVAFVGRHALLIYVLHQIVIIAFMFCAGSVYFLF